MVRANMTDVKGIPNKYDSKYDNNRLYELINYGRTQLFHINFTPDAEVIKYAEIRMFIVLMINLIASTYEVGGAALRGIGYSTTPAVITVLELVHCV